MIPLKPEEHLVLTAVNALPHQQEINQLNVLIPTITKWDYEVGLAIKR